MRKYVLIVTFVTFCSSCASIFNSRDTTVRIITEKPVELQFKDDTLGQNKILIDSCIDLVVPRSKKPLLFQLTNDSLSRDISIPSKASETFYLNFLSTIIGAGIDFFSPKRFTYSSPRYYPSDLTEKKSKSRDDSFNFKKIKEKLSTQKVPKDKSRTLMISTKPQPKDLYMSISFPYVNNFNLSPDGESRKDSWGFLGMTLGVDYYYKNKSFVSISLSGVIDYEIPIPVGMDYDGGQSENMYSLSLVLANNHRFNRFSFGYGLSCSRNLWRLNDRDNSSLSKTRGNTALGLHFNSYFFLSQSTFIGATYRPSLFRFKSENKHRYEAVLSFDIGMKINLSHRK